MPYPFTTDKEGRRHYQDMTQEQADYLFNMDRDESWNIREELFNYELLFNSPKFFNYKYIF